MRLSFDNEDRDLTNHIVLELPYGPGNPRNSEGSFATLADGRILFAYTRFHDGDGADHAPAAIAGRFSDGGRTWSGQDRVLVADEGGCNVMSVSLLRLRDQLVQAPEGRVNFIVIPLSRPAGASVLFSSLSQRFTLA